MATPTTPTAKPAADTASAQDGVKAVATTASDQAGAAPSQQNLQTVCDTFLINQPSAGKTETVTVIDGQRYIFAFNEGAIDYKNAETKMVDGNLVLVFKDGGKLIINNYSGGAETAKLACADGSALDGIAARLPVVDTTAAVKEEIVEEKTEVKAEIRELVEDHAVSHKVAKIQPAAGDGVEQLVNIEPAAGDAGGGGAGGRGGFGFESSFSSTPFAGKAAIGVIGATALAYGANFPETGTNLGDPDANPNAGPNKILTVDESNLNPDTSVTDKIVVDFGADGPGTIDPNGVVQLNGITSHGVPVTVALIGDTYVGTANGQHIFTLLINNDGTYIFTLTGPVDHPDANDPNDAVQIRFGFVAKDADGDAINGIIAVNILDDGPVAHSDVNSIDTDITLSTDGNVITGLNGGVNAADKLSKDGNNTVTKVAFGANSVDVPAAGTVSIDGQYGRLTIAADGSYTYTLFSKVSDTHDVFTYTLRDYDGDTSIANLTINTINGQDDVPVFLNDLAVVDETNMNPGTSVSDHIDVNFGTDGAGPITGNGVANLGGLTSNGQPVTVSYANGVYTGVANGQTVFTLTIQTNGDYTFNLLKPVDHPNKNDPNDALDLVFGVQATDDDGDTGTGTITIRVLDDGPVAHNDVNSYDHDVTNVATGNVISGLNGGPGAEDILSKDGHNHVTSISYGGTTVTVPDGGFAEIDGQYGHLKIFSDGTYTYTAFDNGGGGTGGAKEFTIGAPLPDINPGVPLTPAQQAALGVAPENLTVNAGDHITVDLVTGGIAGQNNTLGMFSVAADGTLISPSILIRNANNAGAEAHTSTTAVAGAESLGFFLIGDGANLNANYGSIDLNTGSLSFVYGYGTAGARPATIHDNGAQVSLVYTSASHVDTVLNGPIYYTTERGGTENLNADGSIRVVSGIPSGDDTVLRIGFEDLPGLDDYDFEDVIFDLRITGSGSPHVCGADVFTYGLTDNDGDTSNATLTVQCFNGQDDVPVFLQEVNSVDETNMAPTTSVSDVLQVNYGTDGPGTVAVNGLVNLNGLTSGGAAITVAVVGGAYVGSANGQTVFTLSLGSNGNYTFTLLQPVDHPNTNDPNDVVQIDFGVRATDADNDTANGFINIKIYDDGVTAHNDINSYDFDVSTQTSGNVITGLNGGPGAEDLLSKDGNNRITAVSFGGQTVNVPSAGEATINGAYGQLKISANGSYTYTINSATGPNKTDVFTYTLADRDNDTSQATLTINAINGTDDQPIFQVSTVTVDETDLHPNTTATGQVHADFGTDGQGSFALNGSTVLNGLTSGGTPVSVTQTGNTYTGTANGQTIFTLVLNPASGGYVFNLLGPVDHPNTTDPNDQVTFQLGVTASDNDGDVTNGYITINVLDDAPVAHADVNPYNAEASLTKDGNVITGYNGGPSGADTLSTDGGNHVQSVSFNGNLVNVPSTGTAEINGQYGKLVIAADGSYTYTLFAPLPNNSQVTDVFNYTLADRDGDKSTTTLTLIAQNDHNDKPIFTDSSATVDESNLHPTTSVTDQVHVTFGQDTPGVYHLNGSNALNGLTSNGVPVTVTQNGDSYTGSANGQTVFTFVLDYSTGKYTFTLLQPVDHANPNDPNDGRSIQLGVTATDTDGDFVNGFVTINILDDAPIARSDFNTFDGAVVSSTSGNVVDGTPGGLSGVDTLSTDGGNRLTAVTFGATLVNVPAVGTAEINGQYGKLVIAANGSYTYTLFAPLPNQTSATDVFTYTLTDRDGDSSTATLTVVGQNDTNNVPLLETAVSTVDETNLSPTTSVNGAIIANFGGDGPGTYAANGTSNMNGLTSHGVPVTVSYANGTYTGSANGETVFTMTLQGNGQYTFTLLQPVDHLNPADPNDARLIQFGVTATDNDGDSTQGFVTINILDDAPVAHNDVNSFECVTIHNAPITASWGADSVCVDEDGQVKVPVQAQIWGDHNDSSVITLTVSGINTAWTVTAPGWTNMGNGVWSLTLPAGVSIYSGEFTFKPPANSDVDMDGIVLNSNVWNSATGNTTGVPDVLDVNVNAVIDTPTLVAQGAGLHPWYYRGVAYTVPLNIASQVTDTDGSEQITKIVLNLNAPFTNGLSIYTTLHEMGITLNLGTQVAPGIWEIPVNAGDAASALQGLMLQVPGDRDYAGIHQDYVGWHDATIPVTSYANEVVLSGDECKLTDNATTVTTNLTFTFYITPLVIDMNGNGIELVGQNAGVKFDMNNDGVKDHTSWVGANDGMLVIDLNNDGIINNQSELFGNSATYADGFANLAQYDSNHDGIVSSEDALFNKLMVWQDANQDGISQQGEMFSLASLGIASISLGNSVALRQVGDSWITHEGTVTYTNGSTTQVVDAWFNIADGNHSAANNNVGTPNPANNNGGGANPAIAPSAVGNVLTGQNGGPGAADTLSKDGGNVVTKVSFGGNVITIPANATAEITGQYGKLVIHSNGQYVYTVNAGVSGNINDVFTYTIADRDGDSSSATLTLSGYNCGTDDRPIFETSIISVDESNLHPNTVVTGQLHADFGSDGQGAFGLSGATVLNGLTSGGSAISVTQTGNTYTGTANGQTIFTLVLNPASGAYTFNLVGPVDHPNTNDPNDQVTIQLGVTASDNDGDVTNGFITVNILDDAPVAHADVNPFNAEASLTKDGNVITGYNGGAGGADTLSKDGGNVVTAVSFGGNVVNVPSTGEAVINGAHGQLKIHADGSYTYTLFAPLPNNTQKTDVFNYTLADRDGDKSTTTLTLTAQNDHNDVPVFGTSTASVDETNLHPTTSVTDQVHVTFGQDTPGVYSLNGSNALNGLTSNGVPVVVSQNGLTYTGSANGQTVFTFVLDASTGKYTFTLLQPVDHANAADPNDSRSIQLGITATDTDNDFANGFVTINILDDAPIARSDFNSFDGAATSSTSGNVVDGTPGGLSGVDTLSADAGNRLTAVTFGANLVNVPAAGTAEINGQYGKLVIAANGSYTYTLFAPLPNNTSVTDLFTYTLTDRDGDSSTTTLTVTGQNNNNNVPVFETSVAVVDETNMAPNTSVSGAVVANFGGDGPGTYAADGNSNMNGLTSNGQPVTVSFSGNTYTGIANGQTVFTMVMQNNGQYTFTLLKPVDHLNPADPNDARLIQFGVQATDKDGDSTHGFVTINILDDAPVAHNDVNVFDHDASNTATGNVITGLNGGANAADTLSKDGDNRVTSVSFGGQTLNVPANGSIEINGAHGKLTLNANGSYSYTLFNPQVDSTDVFQYTLKDADGDAGQATLTLNAINGQDDCPVFVAAVDSVDETNMNPTTSTSGMLQVNFGSDAAGPITGNGLSNMNGLTSHGQPVTVTYANGVYTGVAAGVTVFTLSIQANGAYTFNLLKPVDHANANDPNDVREISFGVQATDGDGDTGSGQLLVKIFDDGPQVNPSIYYHQADEDSLRSGPIVVNGDVGESYGADGAGTIRPAGGFQTMYEGGSWGNNTLYSRGVAVVVATTANGYVGTAGGKTVFTFAVQPNGSYAYTQYETLDHPDRNNPNDVIWTKFGMEIVDADGDTKHFDVQFDIFDDGPVIITDVNVSINNGADDVIVKEDSSVAVPLTAQVLNGSGNETLTLTLTGVQAGWVITAPGWVDHGGGNYTLTLPQGQQSYNGNITFAPPHDSDADMTGLKVTASVYDPDTGNTKSSEDGFNVIVDAVVDTPFVDNEQTLYLTVNGNIQADPNSRRDQYNFLNLNVKAADVDGSETIEKVIINLSIPFALTQNGQTRYETLSHVGAYLNMGAQIAPGVWEIPVNAGDTSALAGLALIIPRTGPSWHNWAGFDARYTIFIEQNPKIGLEVFVKETHLSGQEYDYSDNQLSLKTSLTFGIGSVFYDPRYLSPLVIDLDRDGVEVVNRETGVKFDMNGDGVKDHTSWVGRDDGLLVLDRNHDGIINGRGELFGDTETHKDGFANLTQYDANNDGVIDASDEIFSQLQVWQDVNQDGISQQDELFTLDQLGILNIDLGSVRQSYYEVGDSYVSAEGKVTYADGHQTTIADVWFLSGENSDNLNLADTTHNQITPEKESVASNGSENSVIELAAVLDTGAHDSVQQAIDGFVHGTDAGPGTVAETVQPVETSASATYAAVDMPNLDDLTKPTDHHS